jgi:hypothetical protein
MTTASVRRPNGSRVCRPALRRPGSRGAGRRRARDRWRSLCRLRRVLKPAVNGNEEHPRSDARTVPIRPGLTFHGLAQSQNLAHRRRRTRNRPSTTPRPPPAQPRHRGLLPRRTRSRTPTPQRPPTPLAPSRPECPNTPDRTGTITTPRLRTTCGVTNPAAPHTVSGRDTTITPSSDQHDDQAGESCSRSAP